ncbi:SixA phosphatase family protein [Helicobacter sp. 23-1044]
MEKLAKNLQKIILIRHADTIDRAEFAKHNSDDLARPLSKLGKKQSKKIANFLQKMHATSQISLVLSSPAKRTRQTIKHFSKKHKKLCKFSEHIAPECGIEGYLKALKSAPSAKIIALVGHQFDLGNFVEFASVKQDLPIKKGTIIELSRKKGADEVKGGFYISTLIAPECL